MPAGWGDGNQAELGCLSHLQNFVTLPPFLEDTDNLGEEVTNLVVEVTFELEHPCWKQAALSFASPPAYLQQHPWPSMLSCCHYWHLFTVNRREVQIFPRPYQEIEITVLKVAVGFLTSQCTSEEGSVAVKLKRTREGLSHRRAEYPQ